MKDLTLRKWHRNIGVPLLPLILLQAISGLFLSLRWFAGLHQGVGGFLEETATIVQFWDQVFMGVHYGGGGLGHLLNVVIGMGIVWMGVSGTWIFIRIRRRRHQHRGTGRE